MNNVIEYPADLAPEEVAILTELANGQTLVKACEAQGMSAAAFMQRLPRKSSLATCFAHARDCGAEVLADSLLSIPDEVADVNRARLKADNLKWLLSRRHAAKFGDRIDVNVNATVDLTSAIAEARNRLRPISDQQADVIEGTLVKSKTYALPSSDNESPAQAIAPENLIPDFLK